MHIRHQILFLLFSVVLFVTRHVFSNEIDHDKVTLKQKTINRLQSVKSDWSENRFYCQYITKGIAATGLISLCIYTQIKRNAFQGDVLDQSGSNITEHLDDTEIKDDAGVTTRDEQASDAIEPPAPTTTKCFFPPKGEAARVCTTPAGKPGLFPTKIPSFIGRLFHGGKPNSLAGKQAAIRNSLIVLWGACIWVKQVLL